MRKITLTLLIFGAFAFARQYKGSINFATNSVTTDYESVVYVEKNVKAVGCDNTSSSALWYSLVGRQSDCTDAENSIHVGAGKGFVFDRYPVGNYICVKTASGTVSSGIVSCNAWWEESSP